MAVREKYGYNWDIGVSDLKIEFWMIRKGSEFLKSHGRDLFFHYREAQKLLWPEDDHHRWSDLALRRALEHEIVIYMGCGASNKSYSMARFALTDWWAFPSETLWLVSSTEYRGADLRIWGDIQLLFNRALRRHSWLPGVPLASMHAISREDISNDDEDVDYFKAARSMKRGLIVVPNKKGNVSVGLSPFIGVRVPRLRHAGDEVSMMTSGFLDAYSNWYGNSDFKGMMSGNPLDITDQLCVAAEPDDGWDAFIDTGKTQEWTSKFFKAHVIAFDGRDSPNFDFPNAETKPRYTYMIGPKKLKAVKETYGEDSWQWFSQCVGKPNKGLLLWRVITSAMCQKNNAHDSVVWRGDDALTTIYASDPAYGGGDRCVAGRVQFGINKDGVQILRVHPPEIIPINLRLKEEPEEQIARFIRKRSVELDIPASNCFYDSFGRGTLGHYFAKEFGESTPVPVDSGASPTSRPVRFDLFIEDKDGRKRLKHCDEHYSKFVTEMWFSVAEAIQSGQIRDLPKDVMWEGCARIYRVVKGNRLEIEPKDEMKERVNKSPDLFDWLSIAVEGARQRGFKIQRIGAGINAPVKKKNPFEQDAKDFQKIQRAKQLQAV